ncbi:MAG TPA: sigma-70 family RNA polymerase sigma factor [Polyangiaceae bacterium]|nr:sigma-70 family RNA polymerase sigma factor [Polyangiaceae bacterium]
MEPSPSPVPSRSFAALEPERKYLWGVCYRMTGSAADADDLVQETFVRALERPPPDMEQPLRPWLVRVAMNLSRDQLRRRKRRGYHGVWLPTPIDGTDGLAADAAEPASSDESPEARYGLMESASFAFLVAVEALTASQRAVLLLRDVFDYSSRETGDMLEMTEEGVRTTLHRARKAMADYDRERRPFSAETIRAVETTLQEILACIATRQAERGRALLTDDTVSLTDGGGVMHAGRAPVYGPEKILRMYMKLATRASPNASFEIRRVNGLPALIAEDPAPNSPNAPRAVVFIDLDAGGKIRAMYSVLAPAKLRHVSFPLLGPAAARD